MMAFVGTAKAGSQKPMKAGQVIDGWTIVSIADKQMLLKGNDVEQTVIMNDPTVEIARDHSRTSEAPLPPTVVSIGAPVPAAAQPAQPQPASGQPGQRRVIRQVTPFGIREIEEP